MEMSSDMEKNEELIAAVTLKPEATNTVAKKNSDATAAVAVEYTTQIWIALYEVYVQQPFDEPHQGADLPSPKLIPLMLPLEVRAGGSDLIRPVKALI
jgi:hypothetical protein